MFANNVHNNQTVMQPDELACLQLVVQAVRETLPQYDS